MSIRIRYCNKLITIAIDPNLDLRMAIARVDQANAMLGYNRANMIPFFDYTARARASDFRSNSEEAGVTFPQNSFSLLGKCFLGD